MDRVAMIFEFQRRQDFEGWLKKIKPIADDLQNLAPAEAGDGPNPEYPWLYESPTECPVEYHFELWDRLSNQGQGRKLLRFIELAITRFDEYA